MPDTLAQRVRAKHPGAYDDLNDQQLEQAVVAKFPGVYDDMPKTTAAVPKVSALGAIGEFAGDVAGGLRSSAARTVYGGGDLIRRGLGMERIVNEPDVKAAMTAPESGAGRAASVVGDVGQFFLPTPGTKFKAVKEIAKSAGLTLAQTGSPGAAAASGALTAIPGGAIASKLSKGLKTGAQKSVAQALGATKENMKAEAMKLAPQLLERGVKGSREAMLTRARSMVSTLNAHVGKAVQAAADEGATVSGDAIRSALRLSDDALTVANANGARVAIPGTERALKQLRKLDAFTESLGPDIPFDKAQKIKVTMDHIVSKAGLYGNKATATATDSADAFAVREAAGAFRKLLAEGSPTLNVLNQELGFWKGLRNVLTETERRTQAQSGGLIASGMGGAGAIAGAVTGDSASDRVQNAVLGGLAGRQLIRVLQSPAWRTRVSGPLKDKLADALATGRTGPVLSALGKISASMPGQLATAGPR